MQSFVNIKEQKQLVKLLKDYFYSITDNDYIPALIKKGDIISDSFIGDLYIKSLLIPKDTEINKTWMFANLIKTSPQEDRKFYNLITQKNYNNTHLYEINPVLYDENMVFESEQTNDKYVNAYIAESGSITPIPALKYNEEDSEFIISIHKIILEYLVDLTTQTDYVFDFYIDFEIRTKKKVDITEFQGIIKEGYLEVNHIENKNTSIKTMIRGTVKMDLTPVTSLQLDSSDALGIKVYDLNKGMRPLNTLNYDDDINAGLAVFDNEAIPYLAQLYYFYDMVIIDKKNINNTYLIDLFEDYFVFWEGEFNKLPSEVKTYLSKYFIEKEDNIISEAMFDWQLNASWSFMDKASPFVKLAHNVITKHKASALDIGLSFFYPRTNEDLKKLIIGLEKIYNISPKSFQSKVKDIKVLLDIYNDKGSQLDKNDLFILAQKYSFAILERIKNENKKRE